METEMKIEVADFEPLRQRLRALGAAFRSTAAEDNVYLDRDGALSERDESLRLRQDRRARLTWKGPTAFDQGIVARSEVEIEVSSFDATLEILRRLGFSVAERLAKRRETWQLRDVEVALDTLSFGCFVELEGPAGSVAAVAKDLGLDPRDGIAVPYRKLRRERESAAGV